MNFKCRQLFVSDDELGLSITFSDLREHEKLRASELNINEKYLLLQVVYPENAFEDFYYSIELSDFQKSGELKKFTIKLDRQTFWIEWDANIASIELNIPDEKFNELVKALKSFTAIYGKIIIT